MRYAIIADVHGNLPALEQVLKDAAQRQVDHYLFAGDYCISMPCPNQCLSTVRNHPNSTIIRGNDDGHLERLLGQDPTTWTDGQMQATYWCYQQLSPDNKAWLFGLPHQAELSYAGVQLHMAHGSAAFLGSYVAEHWGCANLDKRYQGIDVTPALLAEDMQHSLDNDPDFHKRFDALPDGIYLFGHSHVQWHFASPDRKKWLINPGSCGLPLDGMPGCAPYSIVEIAQDGSIALEEYRLPFDVASFIQQMEDSDMLRHAPVWCRVIQEELRTGREKVTFFLQFVESYARQIGDMQRPFSVSTWEAAYNLWQQELL